jgi:hypothetical protein
MFAQANQAAPGQYYIRYMLFTVRVLLPQRTMPQTQLLLQ